MSRTTWAIAVFALVALMVSAVAIGMAEGWSGGLGDGGAFAAVWAGLVLLGRAA